jgi:hypothetical protein
VKILDIIFEKTSKALRTKCDCYVSDIIVSDDDVTYASMVAKVLVPEFEEEIGLSKVEHLTKFVNIVNALPTIIGSGVIDNSNVFCFAQIAGGLGSKLMDLPKDAGKAIANCDKQEILDSMKRFSDICKEKERAFQKLLGIEAQICFARMAVGNEAVGNEAVGNGAVIMTELDTKGSNKDGGSGKKCETEVMNKGKTETMGSSKDDRFANNGKTKPMENGASGKKCETEVTNNGKTETMGSSKDDRFANNGKTKPMENSASGKKCETEVTNKGKTETMGSSKDDRFANNGETKPLENGRSANKGKRVNKCKRVNKHSKKICGLSKNCSNLSV